jgi:hypothetical protein
MKMQNKMNEKGYKLAIGIFIASQLTGCASASQSELLAMINNGKAVEIEISEPENIEQGTETGLDWTELGSLETSPELRKAWDDALDITGSAGNKNGMLYVNKDGNQEQNNTLAQALRNSQFVNALSDKTTLQSLIQAAASQYADIDETDETKALYMGINGYFNLLPDSTGNGSYANPDSTIQRYEFMTLLFRADTPVTELEADTAFDEAVGKTDYNIYAQGTLSDSYLDITSKSLNSLTYNGTITRAEAVYAVVSRYFPDELAEADTTGTAFSDAKDGGDIATSQKFIENGTEKDYWKSYELTYAIQNADKGLPTELYKALVVAKEKGLIGEETRWDEGITKAEAVELVVEALKQNQSIEMYSAKQRIDTSNTADVTDEGTGKHEENMNDTKVADGETEETEDTATSDTAESSGEMTDWAKALLEQDRQYIKDTYGLTDAEINALTHESWVELCRERNGGSSSTSSSSSNSSSSATSSSSSNSSDSSTTTDDDGINWDLDAPAFELDLDGPAGEM